MKNGVKSLLFHLENSCFITMVTSSNDPVRIIVSVVTRREELLYINTLSIVYPCSI